MFPCEFCEISQNTFFKGFAVRLRNVLNLSWRRVNKNSLTWWYILKRSWRHLCKTSWRCYEDVLNTSSKRFEDIFEDSLEIVLKTNDQDEYIVLDQDVLKTPSEDVWLGRVYSFWSRRLEDVLKTSSEDEDERYLQDVFKRSSSRRMLP